MSTDDTDTSSGSDGYETEPATSPWHAGVPVGERLSAEELTGSPFFGFEVSDGRLVSAPVEPMLVPERPRHGELDPAECGHCRPTDWGRWLWKDEHWHVAAPPSTGLPFWAGLAPNDHLLLHELDGQTLAALGPMIQRLSGAIQGLDGVARTHMGRWGDGSAHFHLHFYARPLGMMQGRGAMLAFWDDLLPPTDPALLRRHEAQVAAALAADGGEALV
ncbi:hypothetical protein [Nocardioides mesophilus]|uniref:HIT domain-containing protein n=1 Tax=Nocardioides mesophilus TaxID=433659 RepID=A0A7G9R7N2_9ACTN|nr:hypothetical protein [Nocardioides mesophilus]QNN51607.1 hypothetical protein H9L09_13635 [Nocardioides mesophilus]